MIPSDKQTMKIRLDNLYSKLSDQFNIFNSSRIAYLILLFFLVLFLLIVCCNHYFFRTFTYDYGAYNFAFNDYAHLHNSISTVYQNYNFKFIQDHVSFTLILFVPLYWLLSWLTGTYTLLIIQTFIIILGGWAVYKLIGLKTNNRFIPICALVYYFLILGRWTSFVMDCNLAIIASSIVPVFLYFFEKKKWYLAIAAFIFILVAREDMSLWTLFIGLFLLIMHWKDTPSRYISILIIVVSIAYFIFIFSVFIPFIETPDRKYNLFNYSALGLNPGAAFINILKHPIKVILLLFQNNSGDPAFNNVKSEFYFVYLLSGGLIVFLKPRYLILFIPILAKKMLNDYPIRWSIELYYSIEFVSILPIAVYLIIASFRNSVLQNTLALSVCLITLIITVYEFDLRNHKIQWWNNEKYAFYKSSMYSSDFNSHKFHTYLDSLPNSANISASNRILPQLAFRKKIYSFPRVEDASYIVVFSYNDSYPQQQSEFENELNKYIYNSDWNILTDDFPLLILKREKNTNPKILLQLKNKSDTLNQSVILYTCDAEKSSPAILPSIIDNNLIIENGFQQSHEKSHSGNYSIKLTKKNPYALTIVLKNVIRSSKFEISVWRYSTKDKGIIVASARKPADFYNAEITEIKKDDENWVLLKKTIRIVKDLPGNELIIYLWNNDNETVYFDDFKIVSKKD
jgi:uncharacterized membrane protein